MGPTTRAHGIGAAIVALVVVAGGIAAVSAGQDAQPAAAAKADSTMATDARATGDDATGGNLHALRVATTGGQAAGVLVMGTIRDLGQDVLWIPDAADGRVAARAPAPAQQSRAALPPGASLPIVLSTLSNGSIALQPMRDGGFGPAEYVDLWPSGDSHHSNRVFYSFTKSGVEVVGFTASGPGTSDVGTPNGAASLLLRSKPSDEWERIVLQPQLGLYDLDIEGDVVHALLAGPAGTYYARVDAAGDDRSVTTEFVFPPYGMGIRLDAARDGTVAVALAEPNDENEVTPLVPPGPAQGGVRVAVRTASGWEVQSTGHALRGGYLDIRVEPSVRLMVYDTLEDDPNARLVMYRPSELGAPWSEQSRFPDSTVHPFFLDGTAAVLVPQTFGDPDAAWFTLFHVA